MNFSRMIDALADAWNKAGIEAGDTVLVHSNIKRTLMRLRRKGFHVNAQHILDSFLSVVGAQGTLICPLFNFNFSTEKFFDIRHTPSQMGALTEMARQHPNAIRTGHPIYSFAVIGKHAQLFKGVDNMSGYGKDSPFAILRHLNGKIASLDLEDQNSMTFYHHVEEMEQVDYRYFKDFSGRYIDGDGHASVKTYKLYVRNIERKVRTDVNLAGELMWQEGLYKGDRLKEGCGLRTIKATEMYEFVSDLIRHNRALGTLYSLGEN
jgi:aminoglycoside 3-N-acetyltransferase